MKGYRHWVSDYMGFKFENGGRGPEKFDCWGLYAHACREKWGVMIPSFPGIDAANTAAVGELMMAAAKSGEWVHIEKPVDGCAVAMGTAHVITHVGMYIDIDKGHVLHCRPKFGVVCQRICTMRNYSLNILGYYLHHSWPTLPKKALTA